MPKVLVFTTYDQEYAIDIGAVREIRNWVQATPIPSSPSFMEGIINIRGTVIPLVDFCKKINPSSDNGEKKAMVIIENEEKTVSFSVNNVSDIIDYDENSRKNLPDVSQGDVSTFLEGILSIEGRVIFILDVPNLIKECFH
ncbi:chemotaxis protein CheW [Gluconobacter thailandicus]|uniref:Purine-binding chemotaxis protein CheW n=1 Tax=Gluconobacter thailandicus TaxID=257438 RepID=A0AAP9ERF8_GLUTH|nr:chemotaxis protein CheW [Gluconobacter thailandicus]KXV32445.1 chemotaxis protein CheW [Gluconobacter thailandicus]QEH96249.1 purine-binding chemotaxis protein CheW [Gluconobacter thailandicus]